MLLALFGAMISVSAKSKWTVLIYLHGDNDLEQFSVSDLTEAARAGALQLSPSLWQSLIVTSEQREAVHCGRLVGRIPEHLCHRGPQQAHPARTRAAGRPSCFPSPLRPRRIDHA